MAVEIERKYLVNNNKWKEAEKPPGHFYRQGYILNDPKKTVRIRIANNQGFITIKGPSSGASRPEYEYEIPIEDAKELLNQFCISAISKTRHKVNYAGNLWEVDEFLDENEGLIIAEIELLNEQETFDLPDWIEKEVTGDPRYFSSNLSVNPFNKQKD